MVLKDYNINHTRYMYFRNYIHDDYSCYFIKNVVDFVDCKANHEFQDKSGEFNYQCELLLRGMFRICILFFTVIN